MNIKRGQIYYIENNQQNDNGSEQRAGRPAIIVSNNLCNESSPVVEVVYLTTQDKVPLPTHVDIRSTGKNSIALCEQISSVSKTRVGTFICECSKIELDMLNAALAISVDIDIGEPRKEKKKAETTIISPPKKETSEEHVKVVAERDLYKNLYESLLEKLVNR